MDEYQAQMTRPGDIIATGIRNEVREREPEMAIAGRRLSESVMSLADTIDILSARLGPVLSGGKDSPASPVDPPPMSPLAQMIEVQAAKVVSARLAIEDLIARLEV